MSGPAGDPTPTGFQKLIREAHRRSLWQVLGIYLFTSWVVLQVVEVLTESAGLPDWTPGFALVLVLIGLPICLGTAVVQEGMPGGDRGERSDGTSASPSPVPTGTSLDAGASMTAEPGAESPSLHAATDSAAGGHTGAAASPTPVPTGLRRLLTWRNAVLGGVGAFALLGISVATYFVMWSTGVGPVGSLVAQGVLDERDPVVLADFDNLTSQAGLGAVVTEALRVDLLESPVLTLLGPTQVEDALRLMGRAPNETVTGDVAHEIAVRQGIKAVIEGEVASVGSAYQISATIVGGERGEVLKAFRETARSDDDVVDAIDRLSQSIREGAGESLRTIRAGEPLERATTSSLVALQKLTQAEEAEEAGDYPTAIALVEEAVALDPEFAMAYRKLAVLHFNIGSRDGVIDAAARAYQYRDRLTERERYLAEAYYHSNVVFDEPAEILAYRNALRISPDESAALNNLALTQALRGEYDEALPLLERAVSGPGASSVAYFNLVRVRTLLGDLAGAREAQARYDERYPNHVYRAWGGAMVAMLDGDDGAVHQAAQQVLDYEPSPAGTKARSGFVAASHDVRRGQLEEARQHYGESVAQADRLDLHRLAITLSLEAIELDRWVRPDQPRAARIEEVLSGAGFDTMPQRDRPWTSVIVALAGAGEVERAQAMLDEWVQAVSLEDDPFASHDQRFAQASLLAERGRPQEGLDLLYSLQRERECDRCYMFSIAQLLERAGEDAEAAAAWEMVRVGPIDNGHFRWQQHRTWALVRLGPLYERLGEPEKAAAIYAAFADAWYNADPELQPMVEQARERAQRNAAQISAAPDARIDTGTAGSALPVPIPTTPAP